MLNAALASTIATAARAEAQSAAPGASDPWKKPFTLAVNLGLGTPTGFVGVEGQYNPVRYLGFALGSGLNRVGPQLMAAVRPRIPIGAAALSLGAGWSMGPYKQVNDASFYIDGPYPPVFDRHWALAQWINVDAGIEYTSDVIWMRVYFGIARLLNVNDFTCTGQDLEVCRTAVWSDPTEDVTPRRPIPSSELKSAFCLEAVFRGRAPVQGGPP